MSEHQSRGVTTDAAGGEAGAATDGTSAVVMRAVDKVFNAGRPGAVTALTGIDLTIRPGEFVSLLGPSGCGKSTLLRLIGDLAPPTTGELEVNGKAPRQARLDRDYGMVFQAPTLFEWRTVARNVALPLELAGTPKGKARDTALSMLELVGLGEFADHRPWQLSGGMQQRVAIARALSFSPALLLMDEPLGALDEMTRERLQGELLRIWSETGTTVVFVTHSINEAVFLSNRVVVMSARPGRIVGVIPVDLPYPRDIATRESPEYFAKATEVRELLRRGDAYDVGDQEVVG
jgi:NitT/TauT family transport system ATP-binding protein